MVLVIRAHARHVRMSLLQPCYHLAHAVTTPISGISAGLRRDSPLVGTSRTLFGIAGRVSAPCNLSRQEELHVAQVSSAISVFHFHGIDRGQLRPQPQLRSGGGTCFLPGFRGYGAFQTHPLRRLSGNPSAGRESAANVGRLSVEGVPLIMANVNQHNFTDVFENSMKGSIRDADFIAVDMEFSGVESARFRRPLELDTCDTRYHNYRQSATNFLVVQLGICTFKWDPASKTYLAHPYNLYVFGRDAVAGVRDIPARTFLSQCSSLAFLSSHNFDFNTWIRDGISYLSVAQEEEVRRRLFLDNSNATAVRRFLGIQTPEPYESPVTSAADVAFSEHVRKKISAWHARVARMRHLAGQSGGAGSGGGGRLDGAAAAVDFDLDSDLDPDDDNDNDNDNDDDVDGGEDDGDDDDDGREAEAHAGEGRKGTGGSAQELGDATGGSGGSGGGRRGGELAADGNAAEVAYGKSISGEKHPMRTVRTKTSKQMRIAKQGKKIVFKEFPNLLPRMDGHGGAFLLKLYYCSSREEKEELIRELVERRREILEQQVAQARGVRLVIEELAAARKPLVCHNSILDLTHMYHKFYGPLPETAGEFSRAVTALFPCIMDTKYLARAVPRLRELFQGANLAVFYDRAMRHMQTGGKDGGPGGVGVSMAPDLSRYQDGSGSYKHEAGFDAYMTGVIFSQALSILKVDGAELRHLPRAVAQHSTSEAQPPPSRQLAPPGNAVARLAAYANVVPVGRQLAKDMAFDLAAGREAVGERDLPGPKPKANRRGDRANVAVLWELPAGHMDERRLKAAVLRVLGGGAAPRAAGGRPAYAHVVFIDGASVFVEFATSLACTRFLTALDCARRGEFGAPEGAAALLAGGTQFGRFREFQQVCRGTLPVLSFSEGARLSGIAGGLREGQLVGDDAGAAAEAAAALAEVAAGGGQVEDHHWDVPATGASAGGPAGGRDVQVAARGAMTKLGPGGGRMAQQEAVGYGGATHTPGGSTGLGAHDGFWSDHPRGLDGAPGVTLRGGGSNEGGEHLTGGHQAVREEGEGRTAARHTHNRYKGNGHGISSTIIYKKDDNFGPPKPSYRARPSSMEAGSEGGPAQAGKPERRRGGGKAASGSKSLGSDLHQPPQRVQPEATPDAASGGASSSYGAANPGHLTDDLRAGLSGGRGGNSIGGEGRGGGGGGGGERQSPGQTAAAEDVVSKEKRRQVADQGEDLPELLKKPKPLLADAGKGSKFSSWAVRGAREDSQH